MQVPRILVFLLLCVVAMSAAPSQQQQQRHQTPIPINVINLDQDTIRWEKVTAELASNNVPSHLIQRLPAVYGKTLSKEDLCRNVTAIAHNFCTPGIIGCYLSHRLFWQKTAASDTPYQIVLEDDVIVSDDFLQRVQALIDELQENQETRDKWDVLLLGALGCVHPDGKHGLNRISALVAGGGRKPKRVSTHVHIPRRPFGTHAYVLTKGGAKKLIHHAWIVNGHVDVVAWGVRDLCIVACHPMLAHQSMETPSTIGAVTSGIETWIPKIKLCDYTGITLEWVWNEPVLRLGSFVMTYGRAFLFIFGGFGLSFALLDKMPWLLPLQTVLFVVLLSITKIMTRPVRARSETVLF